MTRSFAVTWDYRCPFARNAHEHVLTGLEAGADWDVTFLPFSLGQAHVQEGEPSVWEKPEQDTGIIALQAGVTVRDEHPDAFRAVHRALFAVRHDDAQKLTDRDVISAVLRRHDIDPASVFAAIDDGRALAKIRAEHERYVESHGVWGVPTFVAGEQAVFVRLMDRAPAGSDAETSIRTVERVLDTITGWPELNELKHTRVPR
ncbi:MAG TPA: DsbA family protein [Mycobacteriales bacterium]|nr:DsbA family protein [Mycobacteriales bacterium]